MKFRVLSEQEWSRVFVLRCRSKRGEYLPPEESDLLRVAYRSDPKRYGAMSHDVFVETSPCGSGVK